MLQEKQIFLQENLPPLNEQENSHSQQQGLKLIVSLQEKKKKMLSIYNDKEIDNFLM